MKFFQSSQDLPEKEKLRDEIAKGCAHILLQATSGSLSQYYNVGPISAPFIQVQLLR